MKRTARPVAIWLYVGVLMIIVQVILGGVTRLTGSGLSITEWQPILGTVPPTNEAQWQEAFAKYQQIAQFRHLNFHFTLEDFKGIYFWEWLHRLWGRLIGIVFIVPFVIFLIQRRFRKEMVRPLAILFLLGALQGLIGWIMVQSGLNDEDLYVSHIRLAIHFILALLLLVYTFWFALKLSVPPAAFVPHPQLRSLLLLILVLLTVQLTYGAFMAGLKAAAAAPTWPDINGSYVPQNTGSYQGRSMGFVESWVNHPIVVHFVHRNLGYLIALLVLIWSLLAARVRGSRLFRRSRWWPALLVVLQVVLGVLAVMNSYKAVPQQWGLFEWMAEWHQVVAMLLLLSLVFPLYLLRRTKIVNSAAPIDQHPI